MTHETVRLGVGPNHEHVHFVPPRHFSIGDRVISVRNVSEILEDTYVTGNAGRIVDLRSEFATEAGIHIEVELTHTNGHPHHNVGDLMLFAAAELEHLD